MICGGFFLLPQGLLSLSKMWSMRSMVTTKSDHKRWSETRPRIGRESTRIRRNSTATWCNSWSTTYEIQSQRCQFWHSCYSLMQFFFDYSHLFVFVLMLLNTMMMMMMMDWILFSFDTSNSAKQNLSQYLMDIHITWELKRPSSRTPQAIFKIDINEVSIVRFLSHATNVCIPHNRWESN